MKFYWLLTTHIFCLFPMYVCFINYKKYKKSPSLFVFFNIFFNSIFSVFYHTYNYDNIKLQISSYNTWSFLDFISSSNLIFLTVLYFLRLRSHNLYLLSYIFNSFYIIIYLLSDSRAFIVGYYTIICSLFMIIYKYQIFIFCLKEFILFSLTTIFCVIISTTSFYLGVYINYNLFHPIWHVLIYITAGLACLLRRKMNARLMNLEEDNIVYNRTSSESI